MLKSELLKVLDNLKEEEDINETILGLEDFKPNYNNINLDEFKKILEENKEIKGYQTSLLDSAISKGVESFKVNKMPGYIEKAIKDKNTEGLTEEQKQLKELQVQIENMKKEKTRAELSSKYTKTLTEKKLPSDLIDFIINDDENIINDNIGKFENMMKSYVDNQVSERMKGSYKPPKNDGNIDTLSGVERAFYNRNPNLIEK